MRFVGAVAGKLLFQVIDAQRHDREAVGRAAGCFGVQSSVGARQMPSVCQSLNQSFVDLFDPIVALLVVAVDARFTAAMRIGNIGAAGDVFFVPEQEVELVLLANDANRPS